MTNAVIDRSPAANWVLKTQEQWIDYFNRIKEQMISAADIYQAGKSSLDDLIQGLRRDFSKILEVTSTRINYAPDDLSGIIIHNYGSGIVKPSRKEVSVIPFYENTPLAEALETKKGIDYLQALFDTSDDPETITKTLEHLSGKDAYNIILWTLDQGSRKMYPKMAVGFGNLGKRFLINCGLHSDYGGGRSRGVNESAKRTRKK